MFFLIKNNFFVILNLYFFWVKNDVAVIYTRDMVKKIKKMTCHCHVGDSADSMGSGANPEESSFFKGGI